MSIKGIRYEIFICDDQPQMMKNFVDRHGREFEIRCFNSIIDMRRAIYEKDNPPDLVLVDLFWVKDDVDSEIKNIADRKLHEFQELAKELKPIIASAYAPNGKQCLIDLREKYKPHQLPIMIYSRTGQLLVDQTDLRDMAKSSAAWLLKDQYNINADIESIMIYNYIESEKRHLPGDFRWNMVYAFAGAIMGTMLGYFVKVFL